MLVVDLGGGSKTNVSDATWHIRLGHVNAGRNVCVLCKQARRQVLAVLV